MKAPFITSLICALMSLLAVLGFLGVRHMNASIPLHRWSLAVWLLAFFSPTTYLLLLLLAEKIGVAPPPGQFVAELFYPILLLALLVCESVVWVSAKPIARRIGWMLFTLFAMLVQCGLILAFIVMATGYGQ